LSGTGVSLVGGDPEVPMSHRESLVARVTETVMPERRGGAGDKGIGGGVAEGTTVRNYCTLRSRFVSADPS
jgi:hypothetical protein